MAENETAEGEVIELERRNSVILSPVVTITEAKEQWEIYRQFENELLADDDYVYDVRYVGTDGKLYSSMKPTKATADAHVARVESNLGRTPEVIRRKTKSAFRKMATFFNLTVPEKGEPIETKFHETPNMLIKMEKAQSYSGTIYMNVEDASVIRAEFSVKVVAPNGRTMMGYGNCSASERNFAHPDHDIPSTAWTRAINRAVSDLIGWGEVSAEELLDGGEAKDGKKKSNLAVFMKDIFSKTNYTMDEVMEILGKKEHSEIDPDEDMEIVLAKAEEDERLV